ncbi:MAG: tetratricopeptide repeat protein [Pseudomonadota bacterium]
MLKQRLFAAFKSLCAIGAMFVLAAPALAQEPDITTQYRNGDAAFRLGHVNAALQLYTIACEGGSAYDCYREGDMHRQGIATQQSYDAAEASYSRACELDYADACHMLANLRFNGRGLDQDHTVARTLYARGCDLDSAASCAVLGNMMYVGMGGPRERQSGADLMRRSCLQEVDYACEQVRRYGLSNQGERSNTLRRGWWLGN